MLAKYFFVAAAAIVGGVMAAKCDAQAQFDLCLQTQKAYVDACAIQDYKCLCSNNKIILANCYALCPQDSGKAAQESTVTSWCVSAGGDNTSAPASTQTSTASTGTATGTATGTETGTTNPSSTETSTSTDTPTDGNTDGNNSTDTTTSPRPSTTDNAGNMLAPAGFMVAAVAVAGLVL